MTKPNPFHVEAFLTDTGAIDTTRYVLKIPRGTLHPGVASTFLTEAVGVDETAEDPKMAHGYMRGTRAHAWVLPTEKVAAFNDYLAKFDVMSLVNHLKALRAKMGPSAKPAKPVLTSVPMPEDDGDDADGNDADEDYEN